MKNLLKWLLIVAGIHICLIGIMFFFLRWSLYDFRIIEQIPSPDQKYCAIIFEGNSGATSKFIYRLSILPEGKTINKFMNGNTFISYGKFSVEWLDNKTLLVDNNAEESFKKKYRMNDIDIQYDYLE